MSSLLIPVIVGLISGLFYGLFFILQRRRAGSFLFSSLLATLRIGILVIIWLYLLPLKPFTLILVVVSFSVTFWMSILTGIKRSRYHGWF